MLEARAKAHTGDSIRALMDLAATSARVVRGGVEEDIEIDQVVVGDTIIVRPDDELGYPQVANAMAGLPETLNDFWRILHLDEVWKTVNPTYVDELAKYDFDRMGYQLKFLWDYLATYQFLVCFPLTHDRMFAIYNHNLCHFGPGVIIGSHDKSISASTENG